jgi:hypothetical protein
MCLTVCCGQEDCHQKNDDLTPHCWNASLSLGIWDFYRHAMCLVKKYQQLTALLSRTLKTEKNDLRFLIFAIYNTFISNLFSIKLLVTSYKRVFLIKDETLRLDISVGSICKPALNMLTKWKSRNFKCFQTMRLVAGQVVPQVSKVCSADF